MPGLLGITTGQDLRCCSQLTSCAGDDIEPIAQALDLSNTPLNIGSISDLIFTAYDSQGGTLWRKPPVRHPTAG